MKANEKAKSILATASEASSERIDEGALTSGEPGDLLPVSARKKFRLSTLQQPIHLSSTAFPHPAGADVKRGFLASRNITPAAAARLVEGELDGLAGCHYAGIFQCCCRIVPGPPDSD
jgi:hypothetical protein